MRPAWSIIFFTTMSGLGLGLAGWIVIGLLPLMTQQAIIGVSVVTLALIGAGLISSTFLGLGVTPAVFYTFCRKAAQRSIRLKAAACG